MAGFTIAGVETGDDGVGIGVVADLTVASAGEVGDGGAGTTWQPAKSSATAIIIENNELCSMRHYAFRVSVQQGSCAGRLPANERYHLPNVSTITCV